MKRRVIKYAIIIAVVFSTHFSVYLLTKHICENENKDKQNLSLSLRQGEISSIEQELNEETISATDHQNAYDLLVSRGDKSFVYSDDGSVLIYNYEVVMYKWTDPLDSNKYYQGILQCFIKYFSDHQYEIDFTTLSQYGFVPEVASYGFAVYPNYYENYHAYANFYKVTRLDLELALEKYKNSKVLLGTVNAAYTKYLDAKGMLQKYINSYIPGDL